MASELLPSHRSSRGAAESELEETLFALSVMEEERDESTAAAREAVGAVESLRKELARQHRLLLDAESRAEASEAKLEQALVREADLQASHQALLEQQAAQHAPDWQERSQGEIARLRTLWGSVGLLRDVEEAIRPDACDNPAVSSPTALHAVHRAEAEAILEQVEQALQDGHGSSAPTEIDAVLAESGRSLEAEVTEVTARLLKEETWEAAVLQKRCLVLGAELEAAKAMLEDFRGSLAPSAPKSIQRSPLLTPRYPTLHYAPSHSPERPVPDPEGGLGGSPLSKVTTQLERSLFEAEPTTGGAHQRWIIRSRGPPMPK